MDTVKLSKVFQILVLLPFFMATNAMGKGNSSYAPCIQMERDALLKFKKELEDRSNRLSSWIAGTDCCKWAAIRCDSLTGHVMELNLANSNYSELKGNISDSILNLKRINHIDLSNNDFGGLQIPSFFGSLTSLKYLNLTSSRFRGMIPSQLGNLSTLQHLSLGGNFKIFEPKSLYSENLQWLQGLRSLLSLDLDTVNLSKVSNWLLEINKLPSLVELHLSNCELSHITPLSHVNFTSLSIFDVSFNNINSFFPKWILTLDNLLSIDLKGNSFYGPLPIGFSNMTSLKSLDLSLNYFNSSLPEWLFSLSSLSYFDIGLNKFDLAPNLCGLQNLSSLTYLDLSSNYLNSTLPDCLYFLRNLKYLNLMSLKIQGKISHYIANLTKLVYINLSNNNFIGSTPKSVGTLCNLKTFNLLKNKFNGELSEFFDSFSGCLTNSLMYLYLSDNNISGHFVSLPKLRNLLVLELEYNFISGQIPELIGDLFSLKYLNLGNNELNGTLPKQMGSMSSLQEIIISNNHMEGIVSEVNFANLVNLEYLYLSENGLTLNFSFDWVPPFNLRAIHLSSCNSGPKFPNWLKSQNNIHTIDLSNNQISDIVPDWFWRLIPLSTPYNSYLNLSHNQLSGRIPNFIFDTKSIFLGFNKFHCNLPRISSNVSELDLSNNSFSGNLHHFLCQSTRKNHKLEMLYLGYNNLSGNIPDCWENWTLLKIVKLDNNNLSGKLPSSIGSLRDLWSLQLRNNNLIGEIPQSLRHCSQLRTLDLSLNAFHGSIPTWIGTNLTKLMILGLRSNQLSGLLPNQLCNIIFLQIMDIGSNNLTGHIPHCFDNFIGMIIVKPFSQKISYYVGLIEVLEKAYVVANGQQYEYESILGLMSSVDLSDNNLFGEIPQEITKLKGLRYLNLSRNHLSGNIPIEIGRMKNLLSLDFSINQLSGQIPESMSELTSLGRLNLSYNNLSGQIPKSTQLQSFDQSCFIGNHLCGAPLINSCQGEGMTPKTEIEELPKEDDDESYIDEWFYLSIAIGFMVGFWGIWGPLLISTTWRHAYFRRLTSLSNKFKI